MILWCDLETTGLDIESDQILEIALVVTDDNLCEKGIFNRVVKPETMPEMDEWCTRTHTESGLLADVEELGHPVEEIDKLACTFVANVAGEEKLVLAGSTVASFDRQFLRKHMPELHSMLHYRNIDVSTIKELAKRWRPDLSIPRSKDAHRALPDIQESIALLDFLRSRWLK